MRRGREEVQHRRSKRLGVVIGYYKMVINIVKV